MNITPDVAIKEIYFQILKTPEGYSAINIASQEIVEMAPFRKELISKLFSKLKKERSPENECKAYFLSGENKVIASRTFRMRRYSRFKNIKKYGVRSEEQPALSKIKIKH
jgi:hypothetical protein